MPRQPFAFPSEKTTPAQPGMNLRDYFASAAITAGAQGLQHHAEALAIARRAYLLADAMMKVRDETE